VAARELTPIAVQHLVRDALGRIDLDKLAPTKGMLKRFFSTEAWEPTDDDALAALIGPGQGWWTQSLDDNLTLEFGWRDGMFHLDVVPALLDTFDATVVPEATPNPRTLRFVTGPIHDGPSRWYASVDASDDPRATHIFNVSHAVENVLVGPDFVAVGLRRPDDWPELLTPITHIVETEFASGPVSSRDAQPVYKPSESSNRQRNSSGSRHHTTLERAWRNLGRLHPDRPDDLQKIVAAISSPEAPNRQVAARLLIDADPTVADKAWNALLDDPSRSVRRATVDAVVDAERNELRPLLERALADHDPWIRWKALRGLAELGIAQSRHAVSPLIHDSDFRVRLEATTALQH
jgi:hypothetical protein